MTDRARIARLADEWVRREVVYGEQKTIAREAFMAGADAVLAAGVGADWKCLAQRTADPPQDCDAPFCGCNPVWLDALTMAQESGWLTLTDATDLRAQLATARERVRALEVQLEDSEAAIFSGTAALQRQIAFTEQLAGEKEQAEARELAVTKLLALHEECDDDVPCSILSDLRALLAPPAPAP